MSEYVFPLGLLALIAGIALTGLAAAIGIVQAIVWRAKSKRFFLGTLFAGLGLSGAGVLVTRMAPALEFRLDREEVHAVTIRAQPLVDAIERYELEHGSAPDVLSTLVPAYLPAVPGTGWSRHPNFEYTNYNDEWRLWVDTYKFAAFDTFEYAPDRHHQGFGSADRIGDWVYGHE